MMILYICEQCGRWQDVSIAQAITNAWNNAIGEGLKVPAHKQQGVACPEGCGLMRLINASDRLAIRPEEEEASEPTTDEQETQESPRPGLTLVE